MRIRAAVGLLALVFLVASSGARVAHGAHAVQGGELLASVSVDARHPWVDSGLRVTKGDRLRFEVSGTIQWGSAPDQVAGPDGRDGRPDKPGPGALIGRIGYSGKAFPIGSATAPITMSKTGKLFLGINDFVFHDNSGAFTVRVMKAPRS